MKVKDLVPVTVDRVQLFYKVGDALSPVYENIGEACYLEEMPEELLGLEIIFIVPGMDDSTALEVRVDYKGENNFAERFEALAQKFADINEAMTNPEKGGGITSVQEEQDIRRLESENTVMRKALQSIVAYEVHKYIPGKFAKSPYATAYGVIREYAKFALDTISEQNPQ